MRVVLPIKIDDAKFVSSTAPENDAPVWSAATSYPTGQKVMLSHRVWESIAPGANLNHAPATSPEWWLDTGPTNRWAMFDEVVGTQTWGATPLIVKTQPGRIQNVALLNLDAAAVRVVLRDAPSGAIVYDQTKSFLTGDTIDNWYDYFFAPFSQETDGIFSGLPPYDSGELEVTISKPINDVAVGTLIAGTGLLIGSTESGARVGITDYSRKEADAFGNYMVVERAFSKRMSARVMVETGFTNELLRILSGYRAQPLLWIASNELSATIVYGFYKSFEIDLAFANISYCSLDIEGLI